MASINSMTFDQSAYAAGATITLTVAYTPDTTPVTTPTTFTATTVITDASGAQVATSSGDFVVDEVTVPGDVLATTDTGSRTWAKITDDGATAVFTATA